MSLRVATTEDLPVKPGWEFDWMGDRLPCLETDERGECHFQGFGWLSPQAAQGLAESGLIYCPEGSDR